MTDLLPIPSLTDLLWIVLGLCLLLPVVNWYVHGRPTNGRKLRGAYPIHGFVGPNGGGKSAAMAWQIMPSLRAGRPVLSTMRILDFDNPRPCDDPSCAERHRDLGLSHDHPAAHPLWTPFTRWEQLLEWRNGDVLMDEVTGVASSRDSHKMPGAVLNHLMQLRRADVRLFWSAPSWRRADTGIREVTQAVTLCKGKLKKRVSSNDGTERLWHHRRWFLWTTYDAYAFEDFTAGTRERLRPMFRDRHWGPGSPAFGAYDTFDQVLSIGSVAGDSHSGPCMVCDGLRSRLPCSCPDYIEAKKARSVPRGSRAGSPARKARSAEDGGGAGPDGLTAPLLGLADPS